VLWVDPFSMSTVVSFVIDPHTERLRSPYGGGCRKTKGTTVQGCEMLAWTSRCCPFAKLCKDADNERGACSSHATNRLA